MTNEAFYADLPPLSEYERRRLGKDLASLHHLIGQSYQQELSRFSETLITWLARQCGAAQGVFWQSDSDDSATLSFGGGFACTQAQLHRGAFKAGGDAPYQTVLKDREIIFIEGLEGLFAKSATISLPLRSWILLPISINQELLAAVELYHPSSFSSYHKHLLWNASTPIAAAWSGASEQNKRQKLISQLHSQNESILTQEEELRQQTEELLAINEHLEKMKRQLEGNNEDLLQAKALIEKKNQSMMSSIQYARRIQSALLPSRELLQEALGECALLFLPRDVISGDFYWIYQNAQGTWLAAVDCTGHGVPAALMGMMGLNLLEHIMSTERGLTPAKVLSCLDRRVRALLRADQTNTQDGMDMAICLLDYKQGKIHYSGAMNSAYYFSDKGMVKLKHTRKSIGGYQSRKKQDFSSQELDMEKHGMLYLCSDGYQDQFGGERNSKFMRRSFLKMLGEIWRLPKQKQEQVLSGRLEDWKSGTRQTDDILVLGVRV